MTVNTFGLDIGNASVGWAVLSNNRIVATGVRCFDLPEISAGSGDGAGKPLNYVRRNSRLTRHRLANRARRLTRLARLLKRQGLIHHASVLSEVPEATPPASSGHRAAPMSTWQLRVHALDHLLSPADWARVIYHLCKHRGFHWATLAEEVGADTDKETGRVKVALKGTKALMHDKQYRTAAEMLVTEYPTQGQRNKRQSYDKALSRELLDEEFAKLFAQQRLLGNPHTSPEFEALIRSRQAGVPAGIFWEQKPALAGAQLLQMLGRCTFERAPAGPDGKGEFRAPKASFSAERHVWLTKLNNLRIHVDGGTRGLTDAEREHTIHGPYKTEKYLYSSLKSALVKGGFWSPTVRFVGLAYPSGAQAEGGAKDPEKDTLMHLRSWHTMRSAFKKAGHEDLWLQISTPALEGEPDWLDGIAWALSVYKDAHHIRDALTALQLPHADQSIAVLERLSFDQFSNLSLKALRRIVPHMASGKRFDEAAALEYGHHSVTNNHTPKQPLLPPFYKGARTYKGRHDRVGTMALRDDITIANNPVVLRALNQSRKVVNELVRRYGSPTSVHIELARDLSRSLAERQKIEKRQGKYADERKNARADFETTHGFEPKGRDLEKWLLYREQGGQCAYSQTSLDTHRVLHDPNYVQIDHAIPYSRSYDNSKNNRVLVLSHENQTKGNRTPYEYLTALDGGQEGPRWHRFQAWVDSRKYRAAKSGRLLRKGFDASEAQAFSERNLNDTRYIAKAFKDYVEQHLLFAPGPDDQTRQRCTVVSGQLTAFLRARWGFIKVRADNDRHHALDAIVIAACTGGMVQRLSTYSRRNELAHIPAGTPDPETGEILNPQAFDRAQHAFPTPWPNFRAEALARVFATSPVVLRQDIQALGTYSQAELAALEPLFVSRAPKRRNGGAGHMETIRSTPPAVLAQGGAVERVALTNLTQKDLDRLYDPERNARLYTAIRERMAQHDHNAAQAFGPDRPLFKPDRHGQPTGPQVHKVKLLITKTTTMPVRGGGAANGNLARVDVFHKGSRYYLVPVYLHHLVTALPQRAIAAGKPESAWPVMDESYRFEMSIYPNDLVQIVQKKATHLGYFSSCDRRDGSVDLWAPDRDTREGKGGRYENIGLKTALSLTKYHVGVLGDRHPAPPEVRRELA